MQCRRRRRRKQIEEDIVALDADDARIYYADFKRKCVDFPQTTEGRRMEITFARWRTGELYTNRWKYKRHYPDVDGGCRLCRKTWETREHVLFECQSVPTPVRSRLLKVVREVYNLTPEDRYTLNHVTGLTKRNGNEELGLRKLHRLGRSLYRFCQDLEFHA